MAMINLSMPQVYISSIKGGHNLALRSHSYFFKSIPKPVALMLPNDIVKEAVIKVSIIGALCDSQREVVSQLYDVRPSVIKESIEWLKQNNRHYADVIVAPNIDDICAVAKTGTSSCLNDRSM